MTKNLLETWILTNFYLAHLRNRKIFSEMFEVLMMMFKTQELYSFQRRFYKWFQFHYCNPARNMDIVIYLKFYDIFQKLVSSSILLKVCS